MIVYELHHVPSGRRYIGSTIRPLEDRWKNHCSAAFDRGSPKGPLQIAIRQLGPESFAVRPLACAKDERALRELERIIIRQERTNWPYGFNAQHIVGYRQLTEFGSRRDPRSEYSRFGS